MSALSSLLDGFATALTFQNILWSFLGVTLGTLVGILPGIGPALTIALLLPVTAKLDPTGAFIMFAGLYYGAMYGSSTTSILLNTPGESGSIITSLEGNRMARQGRGAAALATAAIGSFIAGTIGTVLLTFLAPLFVRVALRFGPAEYFALMVFAFTAASALLGASLARGVTSLILGIVIGLVGIDVLTGQPRLAFGFAGLLDGIDIVIVAVGLFAVGEALHLASRRDLREAEISPVKGSLFMTREEWARSWKPWLRGTALGFPFGVLPAGGTEIPTFLSYFLERKLSRRPEEFGKGAIEGVAGPEAANNAAVAGVLVPLLTLGLPTSATAAILLVVFQQYGLQPGPLAVHGLELAGVGPDRQPLHRQRDAADPEPAAGRSVGAAAGDPRAPALRRHPGVLDARRLQPQSLDARPHPALSPRRSRLPDAALLVSGGAVHHRAHPGAARRRAVPARAGHQPGRSVGVPHPSDLRGVPHRGGAGVRCTPAAQAAGRR